MRITKCRACNGISLREVLNLGEQYVSDFRNDRSRPNKYPLVAVICEDCMLVQLSHTTPAGEMYHENYGFKSGVSDSIKADLKDIVLNALEWKDNPRSWLDIASNDGSLLACVPTNAYRLGVDPIKKYCDEAVEHADKIINGFFDADTLGTTLPTFDVVTSISCFYDMANPNKFVSDVKRVLSDSGVWVIQQNYLLPTIQMNAVDNFCHEHLEYYTLLSLEALLYRHGLEVFDVSTSPVNGGSIRTLVCKRGAFPVQDRVKEQRAIEANAQLHDLEPYRSFGERVMERMRAIKALVDDLNGKGKKIYILAASTRGATIWQAAGITEQDVPYAVERNPEKVGKYFSAVGMPIISEEQARKDKPDYMLVGPWFFIDEIKAREHEYLNSGGHLIVPLPRLEIC